MDTGFKGWRDARQNDMWMDDHPAGESQKKHMSNIYQQGKG